MSKFDTHGGYFAPKDYMRINEGGSHAENPNGGVQVGVDEQGIPNMLEEGEPVYKDYVYSDNIKASERFLDANHIPVKYKGMLYSEIADDLFEEAEERPNDPVSRNGLEAMLGRLADAQEQQKQDSERRKLERELSKLSPEELEALQQELMAAQEQAQTQVQPQEQMPMPEQQIVPEEQAVMEQPVEQMPVEQQIPVMAGGGPLDKFDPFLKKKFPDNPSLTDVMVYRLVQEQIPGMPDNYPYDFKSRYKAQKALNENAASIKLASRMRKRKEAEKNVMNWLDKFDNKYLGDKFIREYERGPYRGEKTFSFFGNDGLLRTFDGGGYTGGGRSGARVELNMDNPNLMTPGLLEWIVPGAKGAKAFKSAAEIEKYLIGKYSHDATTLTTKVKDLEAAKVAAEKTLKEVKSMKTPYKSVEAAKKELRLIGQQLDKFKKGAKEAEELTAALNASQSTASAAGTEVASNVGRASTANAADIVQKSKSVGKKVLTGALNVVDPGRVALSWWKPTSGAAKATKEVVGSAISLPVWGYGYLPAYNLGKDIISNSGDIDVTEAFDDSLLTDKQDTTSTLPSYNGFNKGGHVRHLKIDNLGIDIPLYKTTTLDEAKDSFLSERFSGDKKDNKSANKNTKKDSDVSESGEIEPAVITADRRPRMVYVNPYIIGRNRSRANNNKTTASSSSDIGMLRTMTPDFRDQRIDTLLDDYIMSRDFSDYYKSADAMSDSLDAVADAENKINSLIGNRRFSCGGMVNRFDGVSRYSGNMDKVDPDTAKKMREYFIRQFYSNNDENGVPVYNFGYNARRMGTNDDIYDPFILDNDAGWILGRVANGLMSQDDYASRVNASRNGNAFLSYLADNGIGYDALSKMSQEDLAGLYYDYALSTSGDEDLMRRYQEMVDYDSENELYDTYRASGGKGDIDSDDFSRYMRNNNPELYRRQRYGTLNDDYVDNGNSTVSEPEPINAEIPDYSALSLDQARRNFISPIAAPDVSRYYNEPTPNEESVMETLPRYDVSPSQRQAQASATRTSAPVTNGSTPYETGPIYSGTDFDDFLKWMRTYNGSRNAGNISGTYAPDRKFNYGEYGNIKALEASEPYKAFTDSIINAITDKNADPVAKELAMRYLTAYNEALPESARGKIIDANGNLVDSWVDQYRKVRTYQPGVGHLSGDFAAMVKAAKNKAVAQKPQTPTQPATAVTQQPSGSIPTGIDMPDSPGEASDEVREWVERQLAGDTNPEVQPVAPEPAGNNNVTQNTNQRAAGPYFPTLPRYAGAIGAGLLAAYDAFTPADRYTATRYKPYVPVGHINLQNQRYDPVDQNMIQNQILAQGNSTQRALRNSGLGPSTGAAILAADNNTTRNLGAGFLQTWQANNQLRNAVTAANNQAEGMRAQFDYGVDAARQRALNEAQVRNAQNDLMLQRLNYEAEGQKYNALSNQLNAGFNALAGIGRENFARNQANSNTALEGYKTLGAGVGAHLPYYELFNPVIYGALGGYLKKIKK